MNATLYDPSDVAFGAQPRLVCAGCGQIEVGAYKAIKRLNGVGVSAYEVARLACVSPVTIERIWRGETWRYV